MTDFAPSETESANIGFSSNGEGENKILAPRAIILDQAAKPRGQELSAQGARILF